MTSLRPVLGRVIVIKTYPDQVCQELQLRVEQSHPSGAPTRPARIDYLMSDQVVLVDSKKGQEAGPPMRYGADAALQIEAVSVPETPR